MNQNETTTIELSQLNGLKKLASFFQTGEIEALAKQTGFICRSTSRLTGEAFLQMMVQHIAPDVSWSLNDQCDYLQDYFDIPMTKQSLDERYHTFTVAFLKRCYQAILSQSLQNQTAALPSQFSAIYLTDSTSFELPDRLAAFYKSNGSDAADTAGSSVKIHQSIELLQFKIAEFLITDGKKSDGKYWQNKGYELSAGSLWMADLGYFSWDTLTKIAGGGSYFLSRYKTGTALYVKDDSGNYSELDIAAHLRQNASAGSGAVQSLTVYFGKHQTQARFIYEQVGEEVRQQRLAKYRRSYGKQSKKGGQAKQWEMTALKEFLCGYSLYLTNAEEEKLSTAAVVALYGLRWQIELLFKIWKSLLYIDHVPAMSIFRFECFLYGRLIFILLSTELMAYIKSYVQQNELDIEISEWKTMKLIKKKLLWLMAKLIEDEQAFSIALAQVVRKVIKDCRKEKRKKNGVYRMTPKQRMKLVA